MPCAVHMSARAEADVDEALTWLRLRSRTAAERWHTSFLVKVRSLEQNPHRCPLAHESHWFDLELRELLFGKRRGVSRILFTIEGNEVNIVHVRHAAQAWVKSEST